MLQILIGFLLFLSINSKNLKVGPVILSTEGKYTLSNILDATTRVKNYILEKKEIPNLVRVLNDELDIAQFTYLMGKTIINIDNVNPETKVSPIKLTSPSSPYNYKIQLSLSEYINAIYRVNAYCEEIGTPPAYILSNSMEIGYREYLFGFSEILDYYKTNNNLPLTYVFDSSVYSESLKEVYYKNGINENNTEGDVSKYITRENNRCKINNNIRKKARELTNDKSTDLEKAYAIFNFVKNKITNENYQNSRKGASKTLVNGSGNCCDKSNLIVALCRASNIPVRYVHGQCKFNNGNVNEHVWTQILLNNVWYVADSTFEGNSLGFIRNWDYQKFSDLHIYDLLEF
jgi:hypothetical protein